MNLGIEIRGRRKPTEDDARRLSERIFDHFEDLLLEIEPSDK